MGVGVGVGLRRPIVRRRAPNLFSAGRGAHGVLPRCLAGAL